VSITRATTSPRRWRRIGFALLSLSCGAAAALGIVAVAAGSRVLPAFPGWEAIPGVPAPGPSIQASLTKCAHLGRLAISEQRGAWAAALYTRSYGNSSVCLSSGGGNAGGEPAPSVCTSSSLALAAVPAGQIETTGILQTCDLASRNGFSDVTFARGRVGPGVTSVTIRRMDGSLVQATVARGWFLAWWPGLTTRATAAVKLVSDKNSLATVS
jgi:hypothetical protein